MSNRLKSLVIIISTLVILIIMMMIFRHIENRDNIEQVIDQRELSVRILNGCGISGLARDYEDYLTEKFGGNGTSLFKFSEASNTHKAIYNKSIIVVVNRFEEQEEPNNLTILQERTGIHPWTYAIDDVEKPDYQFIIIIGNDFQNLMKQER